MVNLIVGKRRIRAQDRGTGTERRGELHGNLQSKGLRALTGRWGVSCRCGWAPPGGTRGWLCCRQAPWFAPVRLKEPIAGRCQGKRRGRGAGNTVPRPLMPARYRLRSRGEGGNLGARWMPGFGVDLVGAGRAVSAAAWPDGRAGIEGGGVDCCARD